MLYFKPESKKTDIGKALEFMSGVMKRRCTAFILSDFYNRTDFFQPLTIFSRKHDVMAIQVYDKLMRELPDVGLIKVTDAETGFEQYVDTSSKSLRNAHSKYWNTRQTQLAETFKKSSVDFISVATDEDYVKYLLMMFKKRN